MTRTIVPQWEFKDRLAKALDVSDYGVGEMAAELGVSRNAVAHPRVARYPGAMFHSCTDCLGVLIESDKIKPSATGQYVVKAVK